MEHIFDTIIIGGGPAGYTAALYAARAGLDAVLIEKLSAGGQMALTGDIDNYPGFDEGIDGFTLGMKMQQGAERFGAKTEYGEVLSVDFSKPVKEIITDSKAFFAKSVIIASGANPRELGIENEVELIGRGVHYCAHCDGRFYKDKTVAVIGGGNSAAADALYLSRLAKKVYLIHRRDKLRAENIYKKPLLEAENIKFLWNTTAENFITDNRVTGLEIKNVLSGEISEISCDGVFISIGRKPATEFLKDAVELDENGYIIADETTKTNIDGVFAAGDVRTKTFRQIVTAVADGATAVHKTEEYLG
jgi:thioredoxin reductase (NADPH)